MKKLITAGLVAVLCAGATSAPAQASSARERYKAVSKVVVRDCLKEPRCRLLSIRVSTRPYIKVMGFTPFDANFDYGYSYHAGAIVCRGLVRYQERGARPDSARIKSKGCYPRGR